MAKDAGQSEAKVTTNGDSKRQTTKARTDQLDGMEARQQMGLVGYLVLKTVPEQSQLLTLSLGELRQSTHSSFDQD
jgi:hypothetical protein